MEDIRYLPGRNLNRELVSRLSSCQWLDSARNLVLIGSSSVGKTYLALALIKAACRAGYTCRFTRLDDLEADPARRRLITDLKRVDLLVIDDFLTTPVTDATAAVVLNVLSAREGTGSTLVTSQFSPEDWYKSMTDAVLAESILNRLIGSAEIVALNGPNMRLDPLAEAAEQPG